MLFNLDIVFKYFLLFVVSAVHCTEVGCPSLSSYFD